MFDAQETTTLEKAGEAIQKVADHDLDEIARLRSGQLHLKKLKERIANELEALQAESPKTQRELAELAYQGAQERSSEIGRRMGEARARLNEHLKGFDLTMPLDTVPAWADENSRLVNEVEALVDLWKLAEKRVEFLRLKAQEAQSEPDMNRLRILQRVSTLKAEFEELNWNAPNTQRGQEILFELAELHKALGGVIIED
ncbi:MAG: hypothetical protein AB1649_01510 [Chloroflexota bacterium]